MIKIRNIRGIANLILTKPVESLINIGLHDKWLRFFSKQFTRWVADTIIVTMNVQYSSIQLSQLLILWQITQQWYFHISNKELLFSLPWNAIRQLLSSLILIILLWIFLKVASAKRYLVSIVVIKEVP